MRIHEPRSGKQEVAMATLNGSKRIIAGFVGVAALVTAVRSSPILGFIQFWLSNSNR